jgi:hypothetical protein
MSAGCKKLTGASWAAIAVIRGEWMLKARRAGKNQNAAIPSYPPIATPYSYKAARAPTYKEIGWPTK